MTNIIFGDSCRFEDQCRGCCDSSGLSCRDYEEHSFARTYWTYDDLKSALYDAELDTSAKNLAELRNRISDSRLVDAMVEAGWCYINSIVYDMKKESDNNEHSKSNGV